MSVYDDALLPPHWIRKQNDDSTNGPIFMNEITGEESKIHPFQMYLNAKEKLYKAKQINNGDNNEMLAIDTDGGNFFENDNISPVQHDNNSDNIPFSRADLDLSIHNASNNPQSTIKYEFEYYCKWSERDAEGKALIYGLTISYTDNEETQQKTMIKFDGVQGEWIYSALKGPYGAITKHDLFIGAKLKIFGRNISICAMNRKAQAWVEKEIKKLEKKKLLFQNKIESVGLNPVIRKREVEVTRNITREQKPVDLRKLLNDIAKLGDQLLSLGLAQQI
eukprot:gene6263-8624_t